MIRPLVLAAAAAAASLSSAAPADSRSPTEPGLLFYASFDHGVVADYSAAGTGEPNIEHDVSPIPDGARAGGLRCADTQVLTYWAPGNIYAQRGTLSLFWRSREPVGPTEFPIFRVAYADHSSWDMVWLRIDYNGHGFDAFVTDANLSRTRVSVALPQFPKPEEWVHLAIAWDETTGIRFYVNGKLAAEKKAVAVYDAALDQFGPHARIVSPHQAQSDYNFVRGGDIDELRIYDHMLADAEVAKLAEKTSSESAAKNPPSHLPTRSLEDPRWRNEWLLRYGWNRPDDPPPLLPAAHTAVRKVEIHDTYDHKRWWWKANDGIRETTWPGVYNRSRLPGRNDYFQLPDWDCYAVSGKTVTFTLPEEPWNHLEVVGAAWGKATLDPERGGKNPPSAGMRPPSRSEKVTTLFTRPQGQELTVHTVEKPVTGGEVIFENVEQEEPIAEFSAYYVHAGEAPKGTASVAYRLEAEEPTGSANADETKSLEPLRRWIAGRFAADERQTLVAVPAATAAAERHAAVNTTAALPIVHVLIPNKAGAAGYDLNAVDGGLDGIAIELPALAVKPTHGDRIALNIQVKDPLWTLRNLIDFTFAVKPGQATTLWLDCRDRILPPDKSLYLTVASAAGDFSRDSLAGATVRLVFKSREAARAEHEIDRFTQARDSYAMLVEEHPHDARFNLWNRFEGDLRDLLRVNPEHKLGRYYAEAAAVSGAQRVDIPLPPVASDKPAWAVRQVQVLEEAKKFALWYVDHRQIENGELGGGISDDVDLLNIWPGLVMMGAEPEKLRESDAKLLDAAFNNGMFTRGLPTIQADELHSYEEGINCVGQNLIADFGNPKQLERAMETARGVASITGVNTAGHRHIRTSYYSGSKMAEDSVWGYSKSYSYLVLQPGLLLVDYNGAPPFRKVVTELADGLLAHGKLDDQGRYRLPLAIHFATDREANSGRHAFPWYVFWTSYLWTGDAKYREPLAKSGEAAIAAINADALDLLKIRPDWTSHMPISELRTVREERSRGDVRGEQQRSSGDVRGPRRTRRPESRDTNSQHFEWQTTGDKSFLEKLYTTQLREILLLDYINTEGSLWIDRVGVPTAEIQRARLGGVALVRGSVFPGHTVSWRFHAPATEASLGILMPYATPTAFKVIAYNLDDQPVTTDLTGWQVDPGEWEVTQGVDTQGKDEPDASAATKTVDFERSRSLEFTFPPRATTVLIFKLKKQGTPYWSRADLGISREDITRESGIVHVKVHSLGGIDAPATAIVVKDRSGHVIGSAKTPALPAPADLIPKTAVVDISLQGGNGAESASVEIDPDNTLQEITRLNNRVSW